MTTSNSKYIIGAVAVASLVGYGVYFDYQRRNNPSFRKKLAQQRREAKKLAQAHKVTFNSHKDSSSFTLPEDPVPETQEGREAYFMKNLQLGEQLMMQGPAAHDAAATCFYRALVVYPEPQKLLEVLAQSLPEVVLQLVVQKMAAEVRKTQAKFEEIE